MEIRCLFGEQNCEIAQVCGTLEGGFTFKIVLFFVCHNQLAKV